MARPQSSLVRPRNFFEEDRCDFAVSRRTLEASVGRLGRRVFGTTSARAISSFSRARASARLASCVRCTRDVMINTPSCVARLPANARRRCRTSSRSKRDWPTSKRNWTAVETLLTFWPPGPEARTKVIVSSESGMNIGKERLMKYICLGYLEPGKFEGMTEDERHATFDECFEYNDHLRANGHLV